MLPTASLIADASELLPELLVLLPLFPNMDDVLEAVWFSPLELFMAA